MEFQIDELYSNNEIQDALNVGNAGGIRVRLGESEYPRRIVVLTSSASVKQTSENPYRDRVEGDTLVYTGGGKEGDQSLAGVNKRILQQLDYDFPIYGFELVRSRRSKRNDPKRWRFIGLLEYLRHYPDAQLDVQNQLRDVWLFDFRIHSELPAILPDSDCEIVQSILSESRESSVDPDDREVARASGALESETEQDNPLRVEKKRRDLLSLSPEQFEHLIKDVLSVSGFERVKVTSYSQDGGVDVNAFAGTGMWPITDLQVQIQAKRWLHTVGRREVAELRGSLQPFARGAIVTTSHFSKAAINEATETGKLPIVLVDGYSFASNLLRIPMHANEN